MLQFQQKINRALKTTELISQRQFKLLRHSWLSDIQSRNNLIFKSFQSEQKKKFIKTNNFFFSELDGKNKGISYIVLHPKVILCEYVLNNTNTDILVLGRNDYYWPKNIFDLCKYSFSNNEILLPKKRESIHKW